ncbi:hypothetical protein CCHR01_10841 [Colletotrichum chrysophilum]|uniref:Uncharacterized protein n=1 Tax=Colletotrichum chrysophilum TaxID=1836956 RepID=A0AAD9AE62_9PEZI|nr:hypothetical protein CCHR01_10841 [Colletotrichum chrysophilum]
MPLCYMPGHAVHYGPTLTAIAAGWTGHTSTSMRPRLYSYTARPPPVSLADPVRPTDALRRQRTGNSRQQSSAQVKSPKSLICSKPEPHNSSTTTAGNYIPYTTSPVGRDNYRTTEIDVAIIFTIRRLIHLHQSASANSTITRSSSSSSSSSSIIIIIIIKARSSSVSVGIGIICGLAISAPHRVWHVCPSIP